VEAGRTVIGAAEFVDLPEWGILRLRGRIDTGARSSALHVSNLCDLGAGRVGFDVRLHREDRDRVVRVEARVTRRTRVRPSSGHAEPRLFVVTTLRIGAVARKVEIGLVDRDRMIYRLLVGRTALAHDFLVDPAKRYVLPRPRRVRGPTGRRPS